MKYVVRYARALLPAFQDSFACGIAFYEDVAKAKTAPEILYGFKPNSRRLRATHEVSTYIFDTWDEVNNFTQSKSGLPFDKPENWRNYP